MPEPTCAACRGCREIITPEGPAACPDCELEEGIVMAAYIYAEINFYSYSGKAGAREGFLAGARWQKQRLEQQAAMEAHYAKVAPAIQEAASECVADAIRFADERDQE